jgi:pseudaminic acid synthase
MNEMLFGSRKVGRGHAPMIVAEMSGNHNQSLERAFSIVDAAAAAGAHALKIQTYTADTMTLDQSDNEFSIRDSKSLWNNRKLYDLYKEAHTPWEWHAAIFDRAKKQGMMAFSTPFDPTAVDFLESLSVPFYKIASFEVTDIPLIEKVAATKKPIIISTGMASVSEIEDAVKAARKAGCKDLVLLKCTSTYPASPENTNILTIPHMRELFRCEIGLSDHTMGLGVAVASVALGSVVIEKHFTLKRSDGGVDSAFSLEPDEMKSLVVESERAFHALGSVHYGPTEKEKASLQFRRSLYVAEDIKAGEILTAKNLRAIRPGFGLPPKHFDELLGKAVTADLKKGTPLKWEHIKFSQ